MTFAPHLPISITAKTATSSAGRGLAALSEALRLERSGLRPAGLIDGEHPPGWVGRVEGLSEIELPGALSRFDCRNNRLAWLGLQADDFFTRAQDTVQRWGPRRVAVFLGTSTSGIANTEAAYRAVAGTDFSALPDWYDYDHTHNVHATTDFVAQALGCEGPSHSISTACSSSAKVFATAARALRAGLCDAAIVGGVDSLCLTTLFGFHALQLVAPEVCRPADQNRQGISIGEAAGFAILENDSAAGTERLLGYGESSDAHHISSPDPTGRGARQAMQDALARAGLDPADIGYINLHGTGTRANDASEDRAVFDLFGAHTPCSSTKGWTGHCLGAAGILEAVICLLAMEQELVPPSLNTQTLDPELRCQIPLQAARRSYRATMTNSFGFGGTNCSLVLGRAT